MKEEMGNPLQLKSLNHISVVCRSVGESLDFYQNVLGFFPIRRPRSFNFDGAWLFNYNIGIHLLQSEDPESMPKARRINPKDNHISFQNSVCESMAAVEKKLKDMEIEYVESRVEEGEIRVDHDPDSLMIEICNCDNLPVVPQQPKTPECAQDSVVVCNSMKKYQQQFSYRGIRPLSVLKNSWL